MKVLFGEWNPIKGMDAFPFFVIARTELKAMQMTNSSKTEANNFFHAMKRVIDSLYSTEVGKKIIHKIASKRTVIKLPKEKHVKRQMAKIRFMLFINWLRLKLLFWTKESKDLLNELNKEEMLIPLSQRLNIS